jgi:hypothetical protein
MAAFPPQLQLIGHMDLVSYELVSRARVYVAESDSEFFLKLLEEGDQPIYVTRR